MIRISRLIATFMTCVLILMYCQQKNENMPSQNTVEPQNPSLSKVSLIVLGTVQDGGSPHIGCKKQCCEALFDHPDPDRIVVSLGIVDTENQQNFIFEATPDFSSQLKKLKSFSNWDAPETPTGIFLTHAHIGHYTGLMYLGREAMGSKDVSVFVMPKMKAYLEENGPWSQLVSLGNINLKPIKANENLKLSSKLTIIPILVPHRDEFSETVGYQIVGPEKTALFIPDIDKWHKWDRDLIQIISEVDYAFIDASFYDADEINHRDISEIPHPFVVESMTLLDELSETGRNKVWFIHFNHTNPLLNRQSNQFQLVTSKGYNVARIYDVFPM